MIIENIKKYNINWLLVVLVVVSVGIHAGVFLRMPGMADFTKSSYIPISIRKDIQPPARAIPRPPARQMVRAARKPTPGIAPDQTVPSIAPVPEESGYIKPVETPAAEALIADKALAEPAATAQGAAASNAPEASNPGRAVASSRAESIRGGADPRMDYFNAVRLKIERHKKYPEICRQQHMEGQVIVAFAINTDGGVSGLKVAGSSGFSALDASALDAVASAAPFPPLPEAYFKGSAQINVPIAFGIIE